MEPPSSLVKREAEPSSSREYKRRPAEEETPICFKAIQVIGPFLQYLTNLKWLDLSEGQKFLGSLLNRDEKGIDAVCTEIFKHLFPTITNLKPCPFQKFEPSMQIVYSSRIGHWNRYISTLNPENLTAQSSLNNQPLSRNYFLFFNPPMPASSNPNSTRPLNTATVLNAIIYFIKTHEANLEDSQKKVLRAFIIKCFTVRISFRFASAHTKPPACNAVYQEFGGIYTHSLALETLGYLPEIDYFKKLICGAFSRELLTLPLVAPKDHLEFIGYLNALAEWSKSMNLAIPPLSNEARTQILAFLKAPSTDSVLLKECEQLCSSLDPTLLLSEKWTLVFQGGVKRDVKGSDLKLLQEKCGFLDIFSAPKDVSLGELQKPQWDYAKEQEITLTKEHPEKSFEAFLNFLRDIPVDKMKTSDFVSHWISLFHLGNVFILRDFQPLFKLLSSSPCTGEKTQTTTFLTEISQVIAQYDLPLFQQLWIAARKAKLFPLHYPEVLENILAFNQSVQNMPNRPTWIHFPLETVEIASRSPKLLECLSHIDEFYTFVDKRTDGGPREPIFTMLPKMKKFVTNHDCTLDDFAPSTHLEVLHVRIQWKATGRSQIFVIEHFTNLFPNLKELQITTTVPIPYGNFYTTDDQKKYPNLKVNFVQIEVKSVPPRATVER